MNPINIFSNASTGSRCDGGKKTIVKIENIGKAHLICLLGCSSSAFFSRWIEHMLFHGGAMNGGGNAKREANYE